MEDLSALHASLFAMNNLFFHHHPQTRGSVGFLLKPLVQLLGLKCALHTLKSESSKADAGQENGSYRFCVADSAAAKSQETHTQKPLLLIS